MTITTEAPARIVSWSKSRDKYGRSVNTLHIWHDESGRPTKGVVVCLPKAWVEANPGQGRYLVNDWTIQHKPGQTDAQNGVFYGFKTAAAGKAFLEGRHSA